jgi:hypothetical protein
MSFLGVLVVTILVLFLIFVGFIVNCLYTTKDITSVWGCFKSRGKAAKPVDTPVAVKPEGGANTKLCVFEGEGIFNKMIYKDDGTLVTAEPDKMTCDECSNYIYKQSPGECYSLGFDSDLQAGGAVVGACTAASTRTSCPI